MNSRNGRSNRWRCRRRKRVRSRGGAEGRAGWAARSNDRARRHLTPDNMAPVPWSCVPCVPLTPTCGCGCARISGRIRAARTKPTSGSSFRDRRPADEVLVAEHDGTLAGFVELSLRAYAEGCETSPVAYLEGWYVSPDARGTGVGRALLNAAEMWGRAQGCTEFASDAEADNASSADAHRACGFEEVSLVRCFRKRL